MGALRERVPVRSMGGRDHVAVLQRAADSDGARLLPDRDVQEAGQLASAEPLLHLFLEAADEEHVAQDVLEIGLRQARPLLHPGHGGQCTVRAVELVEQWNRLEDGLDPRWSEVALSLRIHDDRARSRAAALLAPAGPGLSGQEIRFPTARDGAAIGPEALRRMLRRIDAEGVRGTLEVVGVHGARSQPAAEQEALATRWDSALAVLPTDWSDLLCELELHSSSDLERAAVLVGSLNPLQTSGMGRRCFRFRVAHTRGYGTAPAMARRCLERLDAAEIDADVRVVRVLSETRPVQAHGAVWNVGGHVV